MKQRRRIDYPAAQGEDYADWRAWALAEADTLDPLLDGSDPRQQAARAAVVSERIRKP